MNKSIIIFLTVLFSSQFTFSQTKLKGKKLEEKLTKIQHQISQNQNEKAIETFENKDFVILEKNVKNKHLQLYSSVKEKTDSLKKNMNNNSLLITGYKQLIDLEEYEKLLNEFVVMKPELIYQKDKKNYSNIENFLHLWKPTYYKIKNKLSTEYHPLITNKFNGEEDYFKALSFIEVLKTSIANLDSLDLPKGKNPNLLHEIETLKEKLNRKLSDIENFIKENKPLSNEEIKNLITTSNSSIKDLKKYCSYIRISGDNVEKMDIKIPNSETQIDRVKLMAILGLDVVTYFNLSSTYSSELKRKHFYETEEYAKKLSQLKRIKEDLVSRRFFFEGKFEYKEGKYDLENGGFKRQVDNLDGSLHNYDHLQYDDFSIIPQSDFITSPYKFQGTQDVFYRMQYIIPVESEEQALEIENNSKNVGIVFILNFKNMGLRHNFYWGNVPIIICDIEQVIFYNQHTNEIIYRKIY